MTGGEGAGAVGRRMDNQGRKNKGKGKPWFCGGA